MKKISTFHCRGFAQFNHLSCYLCHFHSYPMLLHSRFWQFNCFHLLKSIIILCWKAFNYQSLGESSHICYRQFCPLDPYPMFGDLKFAVQLGHFRLKFSNNLHNILFSQDTDYILSKSIQRSTYEILRRSTSRPTNVKVARQSVFRTIPSIFHWLFTNFPWCYRCANYTRFWKRINVWLNVFFFTVIDISMETIYQKTENR